MAHQLHNLKVSRVALVDKGANHDLETGEGAHVVLYKSEQAEASNPEDVVTEAGDQGSLAKKAWSWIVNKLSALVADGEEDSDQKTEEVLKEFQRVWLSDESPDSQASAELHKMGEQPQEEPMAGTEAIIEEQSEGLQERLEEVTRKAEEATARAEAAEAALEAANAPAEEVEPESELEVAKAELDPVVRKHIEGLEERAGAAEEMAKAERDQRLEREYLAKAEDLAAVPGQRTSVAAVLRAIDDKLSPEAAENLMAMLKSMNSTISSGALLTSLGGPGGSATTAYGKINNIAKHLLDDSAEPTLNTLEKAFDEALRRNPSLYEQYQSERS